MWLIYYAQEVYLGYLIYFMQNPYEIEISIILTLPMKKQIQKDCVTC